jgi:hypothetical protein
MATQQSTGEKPKPQERANVPSKAAPSAPARYNPGVKEYGRRGLGSAAVLANPRRRRMVGPP